MKIVKIKPFGVFKISDDIVDTFETTPYSNSDSKETVKELIKNIKKSGSGHFIGIIPDKKELFSFIPIIEKDQFFVSQFPDPIQLYFSLAFSNYQFSRQSRHSITLQKSGDNVMHVVNSYLYNWHLQYKISSIIFLHSTIEAFINYLLPEDFIYKQEYEAKTSERFLRSSKDLNKEQTERHVLFKEKINGVILQLTSIDFKKSHQKVYDLLINLNSLRNDIIHLRSTKDQNQAHFHKVFDVVINTTLTPIVYAVKDFINIIKPDFIEFENIEESKEEATFEFEFESHHGFQVDISMFLKILNTPTKKVLLKIPKSEDETYQISMNWIMQNLHIMAKEHLIYFPIVKTDLKDWIVMEILKTDKKLGSSTAWED